MHPRSKCHMCKDGDQVVLAVTTSENDGEPMVVALTVPSWSVKPVKRDVSIGMIFGT